MTDLGSCTFCEIVAGTREASVVHADDEIVAFLDIQPVNPGHLLVIPRGHYRSLGDLPKEIGASMFTVAHGLAEALYRSGLCDGINLAMSDGEAAGQDVFHCHLHVRPRVRGDSWQATYQPVIQTRQQLDDLAQRIACVYRAQSPETTSLSASLAPTLGTPTERLSIIRATSADTMVLAAMNRRLIEDEGSRNPMSLSQLAARMADWLQEDWQIDRFVMNSHLVGYSVYQFRKDEYDPEADVVYVRQFYIEREWRQLGLGTEAFRKLSRDRFPHSCKVVLEVLSSNSRGQRFWLRLGFQPYAATMTLSLPKSLRGDQ